MPADRSRLAFVAIAVAVATWGCSNVMIKAVPVSGPVASFYRLWLALPLLWLVPLLHAPARARFDRNLLRASLIGGSLFALHQIFFFNALKTTTVSNVALIGALQPPLVLLVARQWFGETATRGAILWSLVALAGAATVVAGANGLPGWNPFGDLLAVANLFAFTAYFLASKRIRDRAGAVEYLVGLTTVAGLIMLALCLATGQDLASPVGWEWGVLLCLALVPGTLGHFLANWAHPHTSAFVVSIMLLAVPAVACLGAAVFLGELLRPLQLAGAALTLVAVALVVLSQPRRTGEELAESAAETDAP